MSIASRNLCHRAVILAGLLFVVSMAVVFVLLITVDISCLRHLTLVECFLAGDDFGRGETVIFQWDEFVPIEVPSLRSYARVI